MLGGGGLVGAGLGAKGLCGGLRGDSGERGVGTVGVATRLSVGAAAGGLEGVLIFDCLGAFLRRRSFSSSVSVEYSSHFCFTT